MSSAVRDLAEAEFLGERDEQNNPLPSRPLPKDHMEAPLGNYYDNYKMYNDSQSYMIIGADITKSSHIILMTITT